MDPKLVAVVKRYAKFTVALAGAVGVAAKVVADGDLTSVQGVVQVVLAAAVALGVRQVPNQP